MRRWLPRDEFERRFEDATKARRAWIDALRLRLDTSLIGMRWQIFVDLVHHAGIDMAEYDRRLKVENPEEFAYIESGKQY